MRRHALLAFLSAALLLLSGCERRVMTGILISKESASWRGIEGTAVTIRLDREIKNWQGGDTAGYIFGGGQLQIFDYTKPILKVEGQTVTLFFSHNETDNLVISKLPQGLHDGSVDIVRCDPDRVCP
jgi:hypothetical protein